MFFLYTITENLVNFAPDLTKYTFYTMKRLLLMSFAAISTLISVNAQTEDKKFLNELEFSLSAGSTGIGFDFSAPIGDMVKVRVGADFVPSFTKKMNFGVEVGEYVYNPDLTPEENDAAKHELMNSRFDKMSQMLESFTGMKVNNSIDMLGEPSLNTFKVLVDVYPFVDKHWHLTGGFYVGSRNIAKAYNTTEDMTSLMSVTMYNSMYKRAVAEEPLIDYNGFGVYLPPNITETIRSYGTMAVEMGTVDHDILASEDIYWDYSEYDPLTGMPIHEKGDLRCAKGDVLYKEGDQYRMTPDDDNMVKATARANAFRPYIGFGYGGPITKDGRASVSFDAGMMFWGGSPSLNIQTTEGIDKDGNKVYSKVDMCRDLRDISGKVGTTVDFIKSFVVYPVLNLRVSFRLF